MNKKLEDIYKSIESCQECKRVPREKMKWPWIGKYYLEFSKRPKILFVGINMNEPGEGADLRAFINNPEVQRKFLAGKGLYGFMPKLIKNVFSMAEEDPRQIYEYFAVTNFIKCSPEGDRSRPSEEMWEKCSFIKDEIDILAPDVVVAMGETCYRSLLALYDNTNIKEAGVLDELRPYICRIEKGKNTFGMVQIDHQSNPIAIYSTNKRVPLILSLLEMEYLGTETKQVIYTTRQKLIERLNQIELRYFISLNLIKLAYQSR